MIRIRILAFLCGLLLAAPLALGEPAVEAVSHVAIPVGATRPRRVVLRGARLCAGGRSRRGRGRARACVSAANRSFCGKRGRPVPADPAATICGSSISRSSCPTSTGPTHRAAGRGRRRSPPGRNYAGVEPECRRHPRRVFPRPGPASAGTDPVPARQRRPALAGAGTGCFSASTTPRSPPPTPSAASPSTATGSGCGSPARARTGARSRRGCRACRARMCGSRLLLGAPRGGPGIELLHYLAPRDGSPMPPDTGPDDLWSTAIVLRGAGLPPQSETLRDPDGHTVCLVNVEGGFAVSPGGSLPTSPTPIGLVAEHLGLRPDRLRSFRSEP